MSEINPHPDNAAVAPKKRTPNNVCPTCGGERVLMQQRRFFFFWRKPRHWACVLSPNNHNR